MVANDGQNALRMAAQTIPDLIVLDVHMPGMSGIKVCESLRGDTEMAGIPIIMLTGDSDIEKRIEAFDMGADDYVAKPIDPKELMARVGSKLRRASQKENRNGNITCGNLMWDVKSHRASVNGKKIELSVIETNLLLFFIRQPQVVLPRSEILSSVWKNTSVSQRTIDHHIMSLRKKLSDFDHTIVTMYGVGYVLQTRQEI